RAGRTHDGREPAPLHLQVHPAKSDDLRLTAPIDLPDAHGAGGDTCSRLGHDTPLEISTATVRPVRTPAVVRRDDSATTHERGRACGALHPAEETVSASGRTALPAGEQSGGGAAP